MLYTLYTDAVNNVGDKEIMQQVWLFGDSYCQQDPAVFESTEDLIDREFVSWPNRLKQDFDLKNFAVGGTGPTWSLNCLNHQIKQNTQDLKNINLIFFVSSIWRLDLAFYQRPSDPWLTTMIPALDPSMIDFGWDIKQFNREELKAIQPYKQEAAFVKQLWKQYFFTDSFENTEMLKIIGNLRLHSDLFKKALVWPIFNRPSVSVNSSGNFFYVDDLLFDIEKDPYGIGLDTRHNHLSTENHEIMHQQIAAWIQDSTPIDTAQFQRKSL